MNPQGTKNKHKYMVAGVVIGMAGVFMASDYSVLGQLVFGCLASGVAGVGKRICDRFHHSHQSGEWIIITVLTGGLIGSLLAVILLVGMESIQS